MSKLVLVNQLIRNRVLATGTGFVVIFIVIVDLLMTRQILAYTNFTEFVMFILTIVVGYGVGSWVLLGYTEQVSKELRSKSRFIKFSNWVVIISQYSFLAILLFILFSSTTGFLSPLVFGVSSVLATIIMGIMTLKFFSWYRSSSNKKNLTLLLYGLAALTLAMSIAEDAATKLLMIDIVHERSPPWVIPKSSFLYKHSSKYNGEIEYKVVDPNTTTLYLLPNSNLMLYNLLNSIVLPVGFMFRWMASVVLLRSIYHKMGKMPLSFWIILSLPLIFYLIGKMPGFFSGESLSGVDEPYRYFFRVLFRAGTVGGNILFGVPFFIAARGMVSSKVKDYLIICGIGITLVGICLSTSALQQTYGMAAHSLVLLSSYLFTVGFYSSVISVSQDKSLRESIKRSATDVSRLLDVLGSPQMKQEIETRVLNIAKEQQQVLTKQTGIYPSITELEMKQYLGKVLKEIKVLSNVDDILKKGRDILEKSLDYMVCSKFGNLRLVYNNYFDLYEKVMTTKYKNLQHKGIRLVTSIDIDSAELVKKFVNKGIQIRHVRNMPPIDFALSDKEMIATIQKTEGGYEIQNLLVSNEPAYMKHFVSIFEELWNAGIEASERIEAIEQGIESEFLEVINDREKVSQILLDLSKSVKKEALLLLPNDIAMLRMEKMGVIECLINASTKISASIKIICPMSSKNSDIIQCISNRAPDIEILNGANSSSGMFIVDGIKFLRAELKDPDAQEFSQAIGFSIYSNSRKSVESFKSIFELLWEQTELSEKLRKANMLFEIANEQLKTRDKQQQEFINIAAHELRTPIQPILGLTEVALSRTSDKEQVELLGIVNRNAKRLRGLTEDLLDVTRIESQSLKLTKERVELGDILQSAVTDFQNHIAKLHDNNGNVDFTCTIKENVFVLADKRRITQVVSNLLSNAIKFIDQEGGNIQIITEMDYIHDRLSNSHIVVAIKDTGKGIDPKIMPRLFSKFSTNSQQGTGLGLYISKNIVEAHGGRIWAGNNEDGIGACFYFTLPIAT